MKQESLDELIELCRAGQCSINLDAAQTGIVAKVVAHRGRVNLETTVYLDRNDKEAADKLENAIHLVQ